MKLSTFFFVIATISLIVTGFNAFSEPTPPVGILLVFVALQAIVFLAAGIKVRYMRSRDIEIMKRSTAYFMFAGTCLLILISIPFLPLNSSSNHIMNIIVLITIGGLVSRGFTRRGYERSSVKETIGDAVSRRCAPGD